MKLKFKIQPYQTAAVQAVVDCFQGQLPASACAVSYRIDPGKQAKGQTIGSTVGSGDGFRNADLLLTEQALLDNIQQVQRGQNLPLSAALVKTKVSPVNLDIEMETGTGKTYCYIKTIFELNRQYGWSKFIIVVPSIAIREGVAKSLAITADHFQETYGKKARFFIYNSKQLHQLESFSSDAGINVIVINVQAFNATGKDNRRIYEELDDFQSRKPIDVISANRPILILDEPQKMEGSATLKSLEAFKASDPAVHLHTVRHTLASRLLLSAVSDAVDYQRIEAQFPWMTEFLVPDAQMDVLFGGEGQSGHGLQAIAALLGHSHPLTTLRHYIHTVGIAFYAHLLGRAVPDLMRAFERRLGSPRTMQRRIQAWREATTDMDAATAEAFVQQHLRAEAEALCPEAVHVEEQMRVDAPAGPVDEQRNPEPPAHDPQALSYERFAKLEAALRGEAPDDTGLDLDLIEQALARIYEIPTGKRGSKEKRHPCDRVLGRPLPHRLAAKSPTQSAAALCRWIEHLRTREPDLLGWLLDRWLFASEKEFGRIRLDDHDRARCQQLPTSPDVTPVTEERTFKRKSEARRSDRTQLFCRIRCRDDDGEFIPRDVQAVRWVMTWTSALLVDVA